MLPEPKKQLQANTTWHSRRPPPAPPPNQPVRSTSPRPPDRPPRAIREGPERSVEGASAAVRSLFCVPDGLC